MLRRWLNAVIAWVAWAQTEELPPTRCTACGQHHPETFYCAQRRMKIAQKLRQYGEAERLRGEIENRRRHRR